MSIRPRGRRIGRAAMLLVTFHILSLLWAQQASDQTEAISTYGEPPISTPPAWRRYVGMLRADPNHCPPEPQPCAQNWAPRIEPVLFVACYKFLTDLEPGSMMHFWKDRTYIDIRRGRKRSIVKLLSGAVIQLIILTRLCFHHPNLDLFNLRNDRGVVFSLGICEGVWPTRRWIPESLNWTKQSSPSTKCWNVRNQRSPTKCG